MKRKILRLFPKLIGVYYFEDHEKYEQKLVSYCDEIQNKYTETGGKNWVSKSVYNTENIYNLNVDYRFNEVTRFINECTVDYCKELKYNGYLTHTNTFFNIYNKYDYQDWHEHPGTHLSGVYCLSGEKESADLLFTDFNANKIKIRVGEYTEDNSTIWTEKFEPGKFLVFRSDTLHCVNRHELDTKRYSFATNFIIQT